MKFTEFIRGMLSEADGTPSNNRVCLFLFVTTITILVIGVVLAPLWKIQLALPIIPPSFESFVEWVCGIFVMGGAAGKAATAYKDAKSPPKEGDSV